MHTRLAMTLALIGSAALLGACQSSPSPASSAGHFGPPRIMSGNPMNGNFQPATGVPDGFHVVKESQDFGHRRGESLPGNWRGFGGS